MSTYRWIGLCKASVLLATLTGAFVGCAASKKTAPPPVVPVAPPVTPTSRPDAMDAAADPAAVLALRTSAYSKSMEAAIARKTPTKPGAPEAAVDATPQTPQRPSEVQWLDPADRQLSLFPGSLQPGTTRHDVAPRPQDNPPSLANYSTSPAPSAASIAGSVPHPIAKSSAEPSTVDAQANQVASVPPPAPLATSDDATVVPPKDSVEQRMAARVHDYPHDVAAHLDYEMSRFITDQPVPDLATLSALPGEDSEMLAAVMDGLSNFRNNLRADSNMLMSRKVAPLLDAAERLRARTGLTIPVVKLCTDVYGFGNYKPFAGDTPHFLAGQEHKVIVYCEVDNFLSQMTEDKQWGTKLAQNTVLYSDQGVQEWKDNRQVLTDLSHSRRRDFFIVQKLALSPNLPTGRYLLKVTVEDTQAQRVAEASVPLILEAEATSR